MPGPIQAIMIGAGQRGYEAYGPYALQHPEQLRFVAVAEPHPLRRARFASDHHIPADWQFPAWQDLLSRPRLADAALVCTLDQEHLEPATAAMEAGYHVLLEKPMATTLQGCVSLVHTAERTGRRLMICHVLRYTTFFSKLYEIIGSGRLGEIVTVDHRENVSFWHMAHSFVRGNWRNSDTQSPMILAKCCHDLDILFYNMGPVERLSSFGSLMHFRAENAPTGAPERCTDGCPHESSCPWYAPRLYLDIIPLLQEARSSPVKLERRLASLYLDHQPALELARRFVRPLDSQLDYRGWPLSTISEDTSRSARLRALETGPYGRCVYRCDNNVVDHQTLNLEFESGASGTMCMQGHSHSEGRTMRYDGTRCTLLAKFGLSGNEIVLHDHLTGRTETIEASRPLRAGHGGGDEGLMAAFVRSIRRGAATPLTSARASLESHLMAFAAERSRLGHGELVAMEDFRRDAGARALSTGQRPLAPLSEYG